jgi:anaerobic magnesium-protoporphyrin IX monomethyl ester cyclase
MKVSFVEPKGPFYNFFTYSMKHLPLLGPLYLGTILRDEGHNVAIYNENIKEVNPSELKDSDILGISILTNTAPRGYQIAKDFRAINPKGRVIIGGAHATFLPEEAAQYADHVVKGEGELVISDLVKNGGERIIEGKPVENLDDLPFPDFSLIKGFKSNASLKAISTSRGCPYDCAFCSVSPMFGRRYRFRSTENIIQELSQLKHKHIFFYDDNFAANKMRTRELLEQMIKYRLSPWWIAQARTDIAKDEELVELMAKAGCRRLCICFESMNPEVLNKYNKKQTPEDTTNCIKVVHKYGIKVHGMFISEGYSDIYNKLKVDILQLSILTPITGSRLYTAVKDAGRFIMDKYPEDWKLFDGLHVVHQPDNLPPFEMQKQSIQVMKKFYSRLNAAKMFLRGKFEEFHIRYMGYKLLKKWEAQNRDYLTRLKETHVHG